MSDANIADRSKIPPALTQCRALFNIESDPAARAWGHMSKVDRLFLLVGAELPQRYQVRTWSQLTEPERHRIRAAARRVEQWAGRMVRAFAGESLQ